jgi:hypothetical protein
MPAAPGSGLPGQLHEPRRAAYFLGGICFEQQLAVSAKTICQKSENRYAVDPELIHQGRACSAPSISAIGGFQTASA